MYGHYLYNYLYKLLGILLQGILSVLPHLFICLIIDFYQYGLMEICLTFWVIIQYYSILFLKLFQLWLLSQLSVYSCVPFIIPYLFKALLYFLVLQEAPGSSCELLASVLGQPFLQGALVLSLGERR